MNCIPQKLTTHPSGYKARTPTKTPSKSRKPARKSTNSKKRVPGHHMDRRRNSKASRTSKTVEKTRYSRANTRNSVSRSANKNKKKSVRNSQKKQIKGKRANRSRTPSKASKNGGKPIWERLYSMAKPKTETTLDDEIEEIKANRGRGKTHQPRGGNFNATGPARSSKKPEFTLNFNKTTDLSRTPEYRDRKNQKSPFRGRRRSRTPNRNTND